MEKQNNGAGAKNLCTADEFLNTFLRYSKKTKGHEQKRRRGAKILCTVVRNKLKEMFRNTKKGPRCKVYLHFKGFAVQKHSPLHRECRGAKRYKICTVKG